MQDSSSENENLRRSKSSCCQWRNQKIYLCGGVFHGTILCASRGFHLRIFISARERNLAILPLMQEIEILLTEEKQLINFLFLKNMSHQKWEEQAAWKIKIIRKAEDFHYSSLIRKLISPYKKDVLSRVISTQLQT